MRNRGLSVEASRALCVCRAPSGGDGASGGGSTTPANGGGVYTDVNRGAARAVAAALITWIAEVSIWEEGCGSVSVGSVSVCAARPAVEMGRAAAAARNLWTGEVWIGVWLRCVNRWRVRRALPHYYTTTRVLLLYVTC